jgi:Leucine-rich repeat (LRR) protein
VKVTGKGIQQMTNLTSLNIGINSMIENETLMKFTKLTELNLDNNNIIKDSTLQSLSSITKLNLNGNKKITNFGISHFKNLIELNLNDNMKIGEIDKFPNLTRLDLCQNKVLSATKLNQNHFNNITQLDINTNSQIRGKVLLKFSNLEHLNISKSPYITDNYLPTTLKTLIVKHHSFITDDGLEKLTSLTHLDMSYLAEGRISDVSISKLTNLTYLNMNSLRLVTDFGISTLTNLRELVFLDNGDITKKSLSLLTNLTSLQCPGFDFTFEIIENLISLKLLNGDELKKKF